MGEGVRQRPGVREGERYGQRGFPSGHAIQPTQPRMCSPRDDVKHGRGSGRSGVTRGLRRLLALCTGTRIVKPGVPGTWLHGRRQHAADVRRRVCHRSDGAAGRVSQGVELSRSDRTEEYCAWRVCLVVAVGLLFSMPTLPTRSQKALAQHPRLGIVLLTPVEDEMGGGRYAVLAMT